MHAALDFIKAHWGWITLIGLPILVGICSVIVAKFGDPDNDPTTNDMPKWVIPFAVLGAVGKFLVDVLSARTAPGKMGVFGEKWNLPGVPSWTPKNGVSNEKGSASLVVLAAVGLLGMLLAGTLGALLVSGCNKQQAIATARQVETAGARMVATIASAWADFNAIMVKKIVEDAKPGEAVQALETYVTNVQKPVQTAIHALRDALKLLDDALDAAEKGIDGDWIGLAATVIHAVDDLRTLFETLKIPITIPKLAHDQRLPLPIALLFQSAEVL